MKQFTRGMESRLVIGFFALLFVLGGGLIWIFYGRDAALVGVLCMSGGVIFFLLLYGLVWLLGKWAGE